MKASDLKVAALTYAVTGSTIAGSWISPDGSSEYFRVGATPTLLPRIDALREELRDPMAVSSGRVPRLVEFMKGWGRVFLPRIVDATRPDVLVVVPHAALHDLPLHLVLDDSGEPLGTRIGISYSSSRSLFRRCASRNYSRRRDPDQWVFDEPGGPKGNYLPSEIRCGGADVIGNQNDEFRTTSRRLSEFVTGRDSSESHATSDDFPYSRMVAKGFVHMKPPPEILCIMAHGYVDPTNHRMSGLLLERDVGVILRNIPLHGGRYFDFRDLPLRRFPSTLHATRPAEVLTSAELEIDTRTSVQVVVLIGCSAGWGRVQYGDEPASLAETWLHIGAPTVVAPLWDCDMEAAEEWVHHFFTGWVRLGKPKALAARYAVQQMRSGAHAERPERLGVMTIKGDWL